MTILPLVFSFLLVLSFSSYTLLKERKATHFEAKSYLGHMATIRKARNALEEDIYRGWSKAIASEKKEEKPATPDKTKRSPEKIALYEKSRSNRRSCSYSQLNLAPLKENTEKKLHKIATDFLDTLYGNATFYKEAKEKTPKLSEELLSYILVSTKGNFVSLLEEISPHLETLYKMIKGTNTYDIAAKQGYPPLEDFFSFVPTEKSLFRLHFAARPLLEIIFDPDITDAIYDLEKEKWLAHEPSPYLNGDELTALILKANKTENPLTFLSPHISYKNEAPKKTTLPIIDTNTKIRLKQEVHEWELPE